MYVFSYPGISRFKYCSFQRYRALIFVGYEVPFKPIYRSIIFKDIVFIALLCICQLYVTDQFSIKHI